MNSSYNVYSTLYLITGFESLFASSTMTMTRSEIMADKKMIHSVLKEGTIFDGDATKYIEWRLGFEMDVRSLGYGERFFGGQTGDLNPLLETALCHGIGKRLDDGTREMISGKNSSEIIPVLDAQFMDGARATIGELMKTIRDLTVVGDDVRTYIGTLRKLWIKYSARERFLQNAGKFPLSVPEMAEKVVKDLYRNTLNLLAKLHVTGAHVVEVEHRGSPCGAGVAIR